MSVIRHLVERKTLKILDLLIKNKEKYFHLSKISKLSSVPLASVFRIISRLASLKVVDVTRVGKIKIYRIVDSKEIKRLECMLKNE